MWTRAKRNSDEDRRAKRAKRWQILSEAILRETVMNVDDGRAKRAETVANVDDGASTASRNGDEYLQLRGRSNPKR
jgi:hypothetical protein